MKDAYPAAHHSLSFSVSWHNDRRDLSGRFSSRHQTQGEKALTSKQKVIKQETFDDLLCSDL